MQRKPYIRSLENDHNSRTTHGADIISAPFKEKSVKREETALWNKIDKCINCLGSVLTVSSVLLVTVLGIAQVMFRFVIKISVPWTEELMRAVYIYVVFFGAILLERENGEVRTTMLIEKLPARLHGLWETIVSILSIIFNVILIIGSYYAYQMTISYLGSLPDVSQKIFFIPLFIGCPLMIVYQIFYMIRNIKEFISGKSLIKEDEES